MISRAIFAGTIWDGTGAPPLHNGVIVVQDEHIISVGTQHSVVVPADATRIDLEHSFVMPGIVNAHAHFGRVSPDDIEPVLTESTPAEMMLLAIQHARQQLRGGVTTARILGELHYIDLAYRRAIGADAVAGPRVLVSGPHLKASHQPGPLGECVDGAEAMRRSVRAHCAAGVDQIKLMVTGDLFDRPTQCFFSPEEIRVAVDEAHAVGVRVAAHVMGGDGLKYALHAGVDTLEHGRFLIEEDVLRVRDSGTVLVTNLQYIFGQRVLRHFPDAPEIGKRSVQLPYERGVTLAIGNDAWNDPRSMAREIALLVRAGVTTSNALVMATRNGAEACGRAHDIGTLQAGKFADMIAVEGDPLARITDLENVRFVMKAGRTYDLSPL